MLMKRPARGRSGKKFTGSKSREYYKRNVLDCLSLDLFFDLTRPKDRGSTLVSSCLPFAEGG